MPEPIEPHAQPIPQTGAPEWAPPPEDDNAAALDHHRPQNVRAIFFGDDGLRAGWSALLFSGILALFTFAITAAIRAARHGAPRPPAEKLLGIAGTLKGEYGTFAVLLIAGFVLSLIERRRFARYGIGAFNGRRALQFALGTALGLGVLSLLVFSLKVAGLLAFDGVLLHGTAAWHYGFLWFLGFLGVGFAEEAATRGFFQFTLTRGIAGLARAAKLSYRTSVVVGFWVTALLFSLLFGAGHTGNAGESPFGIVSTMVIGFVFCFSLWRTGSLWWAIGYHAGWDWAQSFLYGTPDSGLLVQHHFLASHAIGRPLLSGGLTGPEGSIFDLAEIILTTLIIAVFLKPEPGSYADPNWTPNDRG